MVDYRKYSGVRDIVPQEGAKSNLLKEGTPYQVLWPDQNATAEAPSVFRLLPVVDPETGQCVPYRLSDMPRDFGPWMYACMVASIGGARRITFAIGDNLDPYDLNETPYVVLYNAVLRAIKSGAKPEWAALNLVRLDNRGAGVPIMLEPSLRFMVPALVVNHRSHTAIQQMYGLLPDEPISIVPMTRAAGLRLLDRLDAVRDINVIELDGPGAYVAMYQATFQGTNLEYRSYDMKIGRGPYRHISTALGDYADVVRKKLRWWDDIIARPSIEEQVKLICDSDIPADVIVYGLAPKFGKYIPRITFEAAEAIESGRSRPYHARPAPDVVRQPPAAVDTFNPPQRPASTPTREVPGQSDAPADNDVDLDAEIPPGYIAALEEAEKRRRQSGANS